MDIQYSGFDKDIKDTHAEGKYAFQIANIDPTYTSQQKGTPGIKFDLVVTDGPAQDDEGASAVGSHFFPILWLPNDGQKPEGKRMCAKKINDLIDATGLHEARIAGGLQWEDLLGRSFVATNKVKSDEFGEKDELSKFEPLGA